MASFRELNAFATDVTGGWSSDMQRTEQVKINRLNSTLANCVRDAGLRSPRIYLKMDTQGWDDEVVEGSTDSIKSVVALQSEMSVRPIYENVIDYISFISKLNALGFALSGMFPITLASDLIVVEFDCVIVMGNRSL
jgi:hypothetical protein